MEDVQNRFARELADAIASAVAQSADVERCRERAKAAGYRLRVTLEATVGFASVDGNGDAQGDEATDVAGTTDAEPSVPGSFEISANDRRFLRSLRISAGEAAVEEAN